MRQGDRPMDQTKRLQQRAQRLKQLVHCGPDTDMGKLLRRFWHPIALSRDVDRCKALGVRILGEDLTVYRGESGRVYAVGARCAHRKTLLHTGWIVGEEIRCMYHGWQYDGTGHCTLRPAEGDTQLPAIGIGGYPLKEYAGLIFAYMGALPAPAFDLPRKDVFERSDTLYFTRAEPWNCNWFQQVENSLDAVHVSFVHQKGKVGVFGAAVSGAIPELDYIETDAGIRQIATRGKNNVRISDWTFPNANHIVVPGLAQDDPWLHVGHWVVPNDDEHTTRIIAYAIPSSTPEADRRITDYFARYGDYNPADHHDALFRHNRYPEDPLIQLTSAQDYVAAMGQGTIADRSDEWLGRSDAGIALLRSVFLREMEAVRRGRATKHWRRLVHPAELPKQAAEKARV
jgi:5,5'-dehydrodivanillate O-demethylase oxygenase subunit